MKFPSTFCQRPFCGRWRQVRLVCSLLLSVLPSATSLRSQSLRPALQARLVTLTSSSKSAILVWDVQRQEPLAAVREDAFSSSRCLGSLVKPLLLLAYLEACERIDTQLPLRRCEGRSSWCPIDCWYKPGHGRLDIKTALAVSCNPFFFQLAERTPPEVFFRTLRTVGVYPQGLLAQSSKTRVTTSRIPPQALIGVDANLRFIPLQVFKAYLSLLTDAAPTPISLVAGTALETPASVVADGLRLSALEGTSVLADRALPANQHLMGKTGTSPAFIQGSYSDHRTDGWFIGLYPDSQPSLAVLVCYPDGLGAKHAAPLGGQAIRACLELLK